MTFYLSSREEDVEFVNDFVKICPGVSSCDPLPLIQKNSEVPGTTVTDPLDWTTCLFFTNINRVSYTLCTLTCLTLKGLTVLLRGC